MKNITDKQKLFVDEYLIDLNAKAAAIRAGYSEKTAHQIAYQLLQKDAVKEYLHKRQIDRSIRTEISQDMVLSELAKIGFADIRKAVTWSPSMGEMVVHDGNDYVTVQTNGVVLVPSKDIDDSTAGAISEISNTKEGVKLKMHDKQAALVSIGRHLGMFNDKLKLGGDKDNPIGISVSADNAKSMLADMINIVSDDKK